jgi:hypothetical protein
MNTLVYQVIVDFGGVHLLFFILLLEPVGGTIEVDMGAVCGHRQVEIGGRKLIVELPA